MKNKRSIGNCDYNQLFVMFNENFGRDRSYFYDIQYPSFFNISDSTSIVNPNILKNINTAIGTSVNDFKEALLKEAIQFNVVALKNFQIPSIFNIGSNYAVTFNMNSILSCILDLWGQNPTANILYNTLNNYNIDLNTGKELNLADVFKPGVDYVTIVSDYIKSIILNNTDSCYSVDDIDIPSDQAFYLTINGIVIYFGLDEIAPQEFGIPKFMLSYSQFGAYVRPQYLCSMSN